MNDFFYTKVTKDAADLTKAHPTDAGWDLALMDDVTLQSGEMHLVDTGIAVAIPVGYVGLVYPRSSVGVKLRVGLANTVGVIDSDYRGSIKLALCNTGPLPVDLEAGQRVAQMVITPCLLTEAKQVSSLPETERGSGGFGSTGT